MVSGVFKHLLSHELGTGWCNLIIRCWGAKGGGKHVQALLAEHLLCAEKNEPGKPLATPTME